MPSHIRLRYLPHRPILSLLLWSFLNMVPMLSHFWLTSSMHQSGTFYFIVRLTWIPCSVLNNWRLPCVILVYFTPLYAWYGFHAQSFTIDIFHAPFWYILLYCALDMNPMLNHILLVSLKSQYCPFYSKVHLTWIPCSVIFDWLDWVFPCIWVYFLPWRKIKRRKTGISFYLQQTQKKREKTREKKERNTKKKEISYLF